MKYLFAIALLTFAAANTVVSGGVVNGGWPGHWGGARVVGDGWGSWGGLTDWDHDGIPDQWEHNWGGWNGAAWPHHWGNTWGNNWGWNDWGWNDRVVVNDGWGSWGGLTDWNRDGIPDQWEHNSWNRWW